MLKQRIVTALVIGVVLIAILLWASPRFVQILFALLLLAGAWEWSAFLRTTDLTRRALYVLSIAIATAAGWLMSKDVQVERELLLVSALWWLTALGWVLFLPGRANSVAAGIAGILVLAPAGVALGRMIELPAGRALILFLFLMVVAADIGAFLIGRRWGRAKLAPRVSPGKTWEGVLGGVALAAVVAVIGSIVFDMPMAPFLGICTLVIVGSIVGDLTESLFKRFAGLKDSGSLLPGHGGILDRIDSMTAAAPLFLLGLHGLGLRG